MLLAANSAIEQVVIVTAIRIALFIFTCYSDINQHAFNRSRAASLL